METFIHAICDCGWILEKAGSKTDEMYCANPRCENKTKMFKVRVYIEEVKEVKDVVSDNGYTSVC